MIPSVISTQVRQGIEDFLRTTYPPAEPFFADVLENLFAEHETLFKGPYVTLKLPFRPGKQGGGMSPELPMHFPPYRHQERAFDRLKGDSPQSTLIATGTGSGKTECFLYPLLDYCRRHRGEPGVKAIIIYPMNALATDQAKRFAKEIHNNPFLKGNVTAGLFVGGEDSDKGTKTMTEEMVITCKETLRTHPPDILMTNYKMLDYLLLRPQDFSLWQGNGSESLKYVVVDELHTFDGAQGTDLACLLRRLLARLKTPADQVCFVGTSATLGDGEDAAAALLQFTSQLFGAELSPEAIIREDVLRAGEFLGDQTLIRYYKIPDTPELESLRPVNYTDVESYVRAQCRLWFNGWAANDEFNNTFKIILGQRLREHVFFQNFIRILNGQTLNELDVLSALDKIIPGFSDQAPIFQTAMVDSMLALVSTARTELASTDGKKHQQPFLQMRAQLWQRELRRMVVSVDPVPRLRFAADLLAEEDVMCLPMLHCRACGRMGWLSTMGQTDNQLSSELDKIYSAFFSNSPTIQYVFYEDRDNLPEGQVEVAQNLCGHCLNFTYGDHVKACANCGKSDRLISVRCENPRVTNKGGKVHVYKNCPHCGGHDSLAILGSRSASLISVTISQLFASLFNDDRKLLAFSDSVQDASHRAGFFGARTYRFNLRTAMQQVLESADTPLTIAGLPDAFIKFWLERMGSKEAFVAQFIAPDMQWLPEYTVLDETRALPEGGELFDLVKKRIHWDVLNEYGHSALIGRTLEKTGCSIPRLNAVVLEQWTTAVHGKLQEQIGALRSIEFLQVKQLLAGLVRNCRTRGGVYAEFLRTYMEGCGNSFLLHKMPFLPSYVSARRAPAFIYNGSGSSKRLDTLIATGTSLTTYQKWLNRCLGHVTDYSREIYALIFEEAAPLGIFVTVECGADGVVFGLNPELMELECAVDQFMCSRTQQQVSAPRSEREIWQGMPSPRFDALDGELKLRADKTDYYADLYRNGRVDRVVPKEHTGLLERGEREELENRFINGEGAPDPNILSCTPTLEMGINIGDLSTVILCSVPPSQANYIQRIGRAGRQDGNAFNYVIATGRPHDLHFFEEPLKMIAGNVRPPGIFLNAPAVLERQLTAFCFDRWMESVQGRADVIPSKLKAVLNQIMKGEDKGRFPYNLLEHIELQRTVLMNGFISMFDGVLTDASVAHLEQFIQGGATREGSLDYRIINRLHQLHEEREGLRGRLRRLNERIKTNEKNPARDQSVESELSELKYEKSALNRIVRDISEKQTFNFFTDEGLLPNYSFPESGVSLRSVIYRRKSKEEGKGKYDTWTHEYERPAKAAIQELAPGNAFYVDGRKLLIDQVDMSVSKKETWRFCGQCSHAEEEVTVTEKAACPKCGSSSWADASMVRDVIKMRQVVATQSDRDSRSYDDSDDREPAFYNKYMLTEVSPQYIEQAFRLTDESLPFGFEFVRKASFREVNFGKRDFFDGDEIEVAGNKVSQQGFRLCEVCGKVESDKDPDKFRHSIDCKHYGKTLEKGMIQCLYMYRQFESEAIRILLPVVEMDIDSKLPSFIAALYMGLAKKFHGSVDHLQVMVMDEPVPNTTIRKKYLVLYDQVPGGTGYLKELMKEASDIMDLLELSFNALRGCSCQADEDKDGCYKCLFAYRVSRDLPNISRTAAMDLLEQILRQRDNLEKINTVEDISVNALFDSELEARFVEALRRSKSAAGKVEVRKQVVRGKPGYFMQMNDRSYLIEPQVSVGEAEGVSAPSKVDFMIYPMRQTKEKSLPVAVFTDGFAYHADPSGENYRLPRDLEQRMALARSGKFLCWSVTYDDVMSKFDDATKDYWDQFHPKGIDKLLSAYQEQHAIRSLKSVIGKNAMDGLVMFLAQPDRVAWRMLSFLYSLSLTSCGVTDNQTGIDAMESMLDVDEDTFNFASRFSNGSEGDQFWSCQNLLDKGDQPRATLFAHGLARSIRANDNEALSIVVRFEDLNISVSNAVFKRAWNGLLQAYNIMQFLPDAVVVSTRFLAGGFSIPELRHSGCNASSGTAAPTEDEQALRELRKLVLEEALPVLEWVVELGLPLPEAGYELVSEVGQVLAEAELAWESLRVAIVLDEESNLLPFEKEGWRAIGIQRILDADTLKNYFQ